LEGVVVVVVVVAGAVVVVVVSGAGAGTTVVVWGGGFTVVWEQPAARANVAHATDVMMSLFMVGFGCGIISAPLSIGIQKPVPERKTAASIFRREPFLSTDRG
jgi:hypothetical protein